MTSSEAADALGVHRSTVARWVTAGKLWPSETYRAGGLTVYLFEREHIADVAMAERRTA